MEPAKEWGFEEYIKTPSEFYTSFRILADGYGNIHYGMLIRSREEQGVKRLQGFERQADKVTDYDKDKKILKDSFGLDAPDIVSNTAQGGIKIPLNEERVADKTNRQVLAEHGISPDYPEIPAALAEKASAVGKIIKGCFPYTGVDFIYDVNRRDFFLEANLYPTLFAQGLGISEDEITQNVINPQDRGHVQTYLRRVLIRKIAANVNAKDSV